MPARMTISVITIISSMRVNPSNLLPDVPRNHLPVTVFGSVERGRAVLRVHVEHVLSAPRRGVRLVLVRPQAPFHAVGHRVDRNPPQVLELPAARVVRHGDALDERLEIRRIAFVVGPQLRRRNLPDVDRVLELVDRRPDLAQVAPKLRFALALRRHLRQRQYRRRQDYQNRDDDEQLDEGVTPGSHGSSTGRSPPGPEPAAAMRPCRPAPWPSP